MRALIIGPQPEPITGVSLANQIVCTYLPKYTDISVETINTNYTVLKEDIGKFDLSKVWHYFKQYKYIYKIKSADIIYTTPGQTFWGVLKYYPYFLMAKLAGKELIVHIHGNHLWREYENLKGLKKTILKTVLSMNNKGIVLSHTLKINLLPFLSEKNIFILENFVEDFLFEDSTEKKLDKLRIIYLSNLMQEKGIEDVLQSLLTLKKANIDFEAKIAGGMDAIMKPKLESYFNKLSDNTHYLGTVYGDKKRKLLEWGNVFIFPTYYAMEGQPIAIFEAMATGNIILTTAHAGIPDVFENGVNGFYVDKKSSSSITYMLTELNTNLSKYKNISVHNKQVAKEKYRVKRFIKKLSDIMEN